MKLVAVFALLTVSLLADAAPQFYSFSPPVGSGSGTSYVITGEGRITGVRVWEAYNSYLYGFQLRYGFIWSPVGGLKSGNVKEIELGDGETIIQISGKYAHYVQSVVFTTNKGRTLYAGQPSGHTFNMYAAHPDAELRFLSGRYHGAITSIGAHWAVVDMSGNSTANH
ncbi:zymogen granule membrane protein 16-like [Symphorus nematophorus]